MDTGTPLQTPSDPQGAPPDADRPAPPVERLSRRRDGRMLAGVCGGLADWFDVDPTLVRVAFAVLGALGGLAVPIYLAAWLLIPEEGTDVSVAEELLARERSR
jgi:phage shock protein C